MQERSEDQIFAHRIDLQVGETVFKGTVLSSSKSAEWREKYFSAVNEITKGSSDAIAPAEFFDVVGKVILADPTKMVALMHEYDPKIPAAFFGEATDEEIELNFSRICKVAFPSKGLLPIVMERLGTSLPLVLAKFSQSQLRS